MRILMEDAVYYNNNNEKKKNHHRRHHLDWACVFPDRQRKKRI